MMQERFGSTPLIATATYCAASLTMMFANKAVLSVYKFDYQLALIAFQSEHRKLTLDKALLVC
ncbi:hypothetical protein CAOG_009313 [Capsaspora owczarzaki ATCC 30864]|uniref:Uncharacterized protein n=1 Tax=Capsaspora owczarzaki (strain ATCC 30864) TaxID=595528 RepID=A0A0D2U101_CAPO3|nr:hypothetical protein CAOG_009313 [Capsaspora owczarzaki ATCC 30864]